MNRLHRLVCVFALAGWSVVLLGGWTGRSMGAEPKGQAAQPPVQPVAQAQPAPQAQPPAAPQTGPASKSEAQPGKPSGKIRITKPGDLPKHTYPFKGQVAELLHSDAPMLELGKKVRADVEGDLAKYEIDDASTGQRMYTTLLMIDMLEHKYDDALARVEKIRDLESKESRKLVTGILVRAIVAARHEVGERGAAAAYQQAFGRQLEAEVAKLPWSKVQEEIEQSKKSLEMTSESYIMGVAQGQMQPVVDKMGEMEADLAGAVIRLHFLLVDQLPVKDEIVRVYQAALDAHK